MSSRHETGGARWTFSLIDVGVVLAVIATIALMLTPSVSAIRSRTRISQARTACHLIAASVARLQADTGLALLASPTDTAPGGGGGPLQLLFSRGAAPLEPQLTLWTTGTAAMLEDHLLRNGPGYPRFTALSPRGWAGPYLPTDPGPDPWGHRYLINVEWLDAPSVITPPAQAHPQASAVWVLSAGANGTIDTPYQQPAAAAALGGDDVGVRIR